MSMVSSDLIERNICFLDSALINRKKEGMVESDIFYINSHASMPQINLKGVKKDTNNSK